MCVSVLACACIFMYVGVLLRGGSLDVSQPCTLRVEVVIDDSLL